MKTEAIICIVLLSSLSDGLCQQREQPIIDIHMHAYASGLGIPNPNSGETTVRDAEEHRLASMRYMDKHNVVLGAVSANDDVETAFQILSSWEEDLEDRLYKGLFIGKKAGFPPVQKVRAWIKQGRVDFLGEMGLQYDGRSPSDSEFFEYYQLAQELDIPVGIHTGTLYMARFRKCGAAG